MDVAYAPAFRFAAGTSHVVADFIFGGGLPFCIAIALGLAWSARQHGRALLAEVWKVRGLRPGPILLVGVAGPVDEERAAAQDPSFAPFVELSIVQDGTQRRTRNGHYVEWKEISRTISERPFVLATDNGTRVRVEPTGRIDLADRLEAPTRQGTRRTRTARITPGERIWVRGELRVGTSGQGPYRSTSSRSDEQYTIRAPSDRPLLISSEPIDKEDRDRTRMHGGSAAILIIVFLICQFFVFGPYHHLRARGVPTMALVTEERSWETHSKSSTTPHWSMRLHWRVGDRSFDVNEETNIRAWGQTEVGERAPLVYNPSDPTECQVGRANEIGITSGQTLFASIISGLAIIAWMAWAAAITPWWRKRALTENEPGML